MSATASHRLSETQRLASQRLLTRFFWLNGIVIPCVLENVLLLWALRNGLSPAHVAVLSSFTLLAMPMMFLGKRLSGAIGPPRAWSLSWFCRYLFVLAMLPAPWMQATVLAPAVPWLLTICVFGLFSMRSMGMVNTVPVIGEVTSPEDQGSFQAGTSLRGNIAYLVTMAAIVGILRWRDTLGVYQAILLFGSLLGMTSARMLRGLPAMDGLRGSARLGLRDVIRHIRGNRLLRRLALSWCATFSAIALIVPIAMLAVKRGYGVSDDTALFFTLLELVGAILAAYALTIIADHTGPRPILVLGMCLIAATAGFWAFAPQRFVPAGVGAAFLMSGIGRHSIVLALNHYLLASTATRERIGVSLVLQMVSGGVSGLAGMVVAGGSIYLLSQRIPAEDGLVLYRSYYRFVLLLLLPLCLAVWRLPKLRNWTVRNVIGLVFSIRDLRTLMTLNALRRDLSDDEDVEQIERLTLLASRHSEPVLRDFLSRGRLVQQSRAIRALSRIPFDASTTDALIRVVETGAFTNAWRAAELLGQRRIAAAVPALRQALCSEDPFLRGKGMVALARLKDAESFGVIREAFAQTDNPRIVIHGAQALEYLRQPEDLRCILEKMLERAWPEAVRDEMLLAAAGMLGRKARAYRLLKADAADGGMPPPASGPTEKTPFKDAIEDFLRFHPWDTLPIDLRLLLSGT